MPQFANTNSETHPMLELTRERGNIMMRRSKGTPPSIAKTEVSDRQKMRMLRQKEIEEEQRKEDAEAVAMTMSQKCELLKSFHAVKAEFVDLDGLSWSDPAPQHILRQWHQSNFSDSASASSLPDPPEELDWGVSLRRCPSKLRTAASRGVPPLELDVTNASSASIAMESRTMRISRVSRPPVIAAEYATPDPVLATPKPSDPVALDAIDATPKPKDAPVYPAPFDFTSLATLLPPATPTLSPTLPVYVPTSPSLASPKRVPASAEMPTPKKPRLLARCLPAGARSPNARRIVSFPTRIPQPVVREAAPAGMRVISASARNLPRVADCRALRRKASCGAMGQASAADPGRVPKSPRRR